MANRLMNISHQSQGFLSPDRMTADQRLTEIGEILAAAVRRVLAEQSSPLSAEGRDSSFDILALKRRVGRRKPSNRGGEPE